MTERRFLVLPEDLPGEPGASASVRGSELHHMVRVLRLRPGDAVAVFDGQGRGYTGTIEAVAREAALVRLAAPDDRAVEPAFRLTLAQGIPRHDRMDLVVQKTTEIGVARIVPILAGRSATRPGAPGAAHRLDRWRRVARESARQSGRLCVPEVTEPVTWEEYLGRSAEGSAGSRFIFTPEEGVPRSVPGVQLDRDERAAHVAVGPEGGWAPGEVDAALARGFRQVLLGPRILRTETAGIVAAALLLFLAGEMGGRGAGQIPL